MSTSLDSEASRTIFLLILRIFMFLPQLPYPPHSGGRIVTAPLVEGVAERHEVHLFSLMHGFQGEEEGREQISELVAGVHTVAGTKRLDPGVMLSALGSKEPYKVHRFFKNELVEKARAITKDHPPDVIHCQNFYTAKYATTLDAPRKVLYKENFETLLLRRWAERANPLVKPLIRVEQKRTLDFELESCLWFNEVATISSRDETNLREAAEGIPEISRYLNHHLQTILPSIRLKDYDPSKMDDLDSPFPDDGRRKLVFTGSFNYLANVEGAVWLFDEVYPLLPSDEYSLWFVGQHPDSQVHALHHPPMAYVTGAVPSVQPYLRHADASLVPLRIGGGIRLKILESMALGCPLVSTSVGCEGLHGESDPARWKIADTAEDFARAIQETCAQEPDREALRSWVIERFSPERFVGEMESLYRGPSGTIS
ncbi:MAG: glycosyltransferase [Candidatus Omnitrophica bacterium]|nr:glycosyltransferase [Candidatus Omnitrophota bacterium]